MSTIALTQDTFEDPMRVRLAVAPTAAGERHAMSGSTFGAESAD